MKKLLAVLLLVLCLLASGCTKNSKTTPVDDPAPADDPAPVDDPAPTDDSASVDNDVIRSPFMGISFAIPEGWTVLDRQTIAARIGANEAYASAEAADVLAYHIPYVELWAADGRGNAVQMMIENPPLTMSDGTSVETVSDYMDHNMNYLPETYRSQGIEISNEERGTVTICGRDYESFSFSAGSGSNTMTQTMMAAEKDGYFYTVYITSVGEDKTQEILTRFSADE